MDQSKIQSIIDKIDDVLLSHLNNGNTKADPMVGSIRTGDNSDIQYRSYDELWMVRKNYKQLLRAEGEIEVKRNSFQPINISRQFTGARKV